jgi:hypothetical protein
MNKYNVNNNIININNINKFNNVLQYLDNVVYNPLLMDANTDSLYSVPGSKEVSNLFYNNGYLPYENSVPAIDVLRGNNISQSHSQLQTSRNLPSYYKQFIHHNTTPFASN